MSSKKRAAPKPPQQLVPDKTPIDESPDTDSVKDDESVVLLKILMPDQTVNEMPIPVSTALMDLRMQLCAKYKLSPSSYNIEPIHLEDGSLIPHKPSNSIGSLSAKAVAIKSKAKEPVKVAPPKVVEKTVRLTIKMSRSNHQILRVSPNKPLSELMPQIVEKSGISSENHPFLEIRHPQQKAMALETSRTLNDYKINEIFLADKRDKEPVAKSRAGSKKGKSIIKKFWPSKKHKSAPMRDTNGSSRSPASSSTAPDALEKEVTKAQDIANTNENNSNNKDDGVKKKRAAPEKPLQGNNESLHGQVPGNIADVTKEENLEQSSIKSEDEKEIPPRPKAPPRVKTKTPVPVSRPHTTGKKRAPLPPTMKTASGDPPSPRPRPSKPPRKLSSEPGSPESDETNEPAEIVAQEDDKNLGQNPVTDKPNGEVAEEIALPTLEDSPVEIDEPHGEVAENMAHSTPEDCRLEINKPHEDVAEEVVLSTPQDSPVEIESSTQAESEEDEAPSSQTSDKDVPVSNIEAIEIQLSPTEVEDVAPPPLFLEDVPDTTAVQEELVGEKISESITPTDEDEDESFAKDVYSSESDGEERMEERPFVEEDIDDVETISKDAVSPEFQSDAYQAVLTIPPPPPGIFQERVSDEESKNSRNDALGLPHEISQTVEESRSDSEGEEIPESKAEMDKLEVKFTGNDEPLPAATLQDEYEVVVGNIRNESGSESDSSEDLNRITDPAFVQPEFIPDDITGKTSHYNPNFGRESPRDEFDFMSKESSDDTNLVNESVVAGIGESINITETTAAHQQFYNPATQQAVDSGVLGDQDSDSDSEMHKNATAQEIERLRAQITRMRRKKAAKAAAEQALRQKPFTIVAATGELPKSGMKTFTFVPNQSKKPVYEDYEEAPSVGIGLSKNGEIRRGRIPTESYNTSESDDGGKVETSIPSPPIVAEKKPKPAPYEPEKPLIKKVEPPKVVLVEKKQEPLRQKKAPANYVSSAAIRKTDSASKPNVPNIRTNGEDDNVRKSALPNYYKRFLGLAAMKDAAGGKEEKEALVTNYQDTTTKVPSQPVDSKRIDDDKMFTINDKKKEVIAINQVNHLLSGGRIDHPDLNIPHSDAIETKGNHPPPTSVQTKMTRSHFSNGHVEEHPITSPPPPEENHVVDNSTLPPPPAEFLTPSVKPLDLPAYSPSTSPVSPMSPDSDAASPRVRSPLSSNFYGLSSAKPFNPSSGMSRPKFRPMSASFKGIRGEKSSMNPDLSKK